MNIVIPSFRIENSKEHIANVLFKEWGSTYSEMIVNIILNPIDALKKNVNCSKNS